MSPPTLWGDILFLSFLSVCPSVCLSVCPSVRHKVCGRNSSETTERNLTKLGMYEVHHMQMCILPGIFDPLNFVGVMTLWTQKIHGDGGRHRFCRSQKQTLFFYFFTVFLEIVYNVRLLYRHLYTKRKLGLNNFLQNYDPLNFGVFTEICVH